MRLISHQFLVRGNKWPCFSPDGELLSFASPKESNQRKGDPYYVGLRLPCDARHPGRSRNSPWRAAQDAAHCGTQTRDSFSPRVPALLGDLEGDPKNTALASPSNNRKFCCSLIDAGFPLAELPSRGVRTGKKRNRVRAPQWVALFATRQGELVERPFARLGSGTRRATKRGGLLFGYFFLATQAKVTRHQAKNTARLYPHANTSA